MDDFSEEVLTFFLINFYFQGSRGVIWEHEFYEDLNYHQDRTFFHTFSGDVRFSSQKCENIRHLKCLHQVCMIGFAYSEESEASALYKKVINRAKHMRELPFSRHWNTIQ